MIRLCAALAIGLSCLIAASGLAPGRAAALPGRLMAIEPSPPPLLGNRAGMAAYATSCDGPSLQRAIDLAKPGSTLKLARGIYHQCFTVDKPITIEAAPGAVLEGTPCEGKAAIIQRADLTIIGLECRNISVPSGNGACIRLESGDLTLKGVNFHDSQEGILGGGEGAHVTIEDSTFVRLGYGGRAHGIYISKRVASLTARGNKILETKEGGHGLKSRAQVNLIENNVIAELDGQMSRAIDLPNGGRNTIRGNTLEKGPHPEMNEVVCVGCEIAVAQNGGPSTVLDTLFEGNTIICDGARQPYGCDVYRDMGGKATLKSNTVIGPSRMVSDRSSGAVSVEENKSFPDRAAAGLAPYPGL